MRRKSFWFLMTLVVILFISACSSNQAPSQTPTPTPEKEVKLSLIWFKNDMDAQMKQLAGEFTKLHPNITINVESIGDGKSGEVIKSRFAGGKGPDIFTVDGPAQIALYQDKLADLSDQPWVPNAVPMFIKELTKDGKLYGMPYNVEGLGIVYNKKLFEKAGITKIPTNNTELTNVVKQLKDKGIRPFATGAKEWWIPGFHVANAPFAQQLDADKFMADLTSKATTFKDNPIFMNDFKNFIDLYIKNGEPNPLTTDWGSLVKQVSDGEAAMGHGGNFIENFVTGIGGDINNLGLFPVALNDNPDTADKLSTGMPFGWVVNNVNGTEKESKMFLDFLVSSEIGQKYLTEIFQYIPAYPKIPFNAGGGVSKDLAKYVAAGKTVPWAHKGWPDGIREKFGSTLQAYIAKKMTWEQVMDQWTKDWQQMTAK